MTLDDRMRRKLRTKRGRACYRLRQTNVEPVMGQIKEERQLRQVLHRGRKKARSVAIRRGGPQFAENRWQPIGVLAKTRRDAAYYQGVSYLHPIDGRPYRV